MTNLQSGSTQVSGAMLRRFWFGLPIAAAGLVAFLVIALVLLPQWLALQRDMERRAQLETLRDKVLKTRLLLQGLDEQEQKAQQQQTKLFDIVTGNGDLSTFMAIVDREAKQAGVQLELFEPQAEAPTEPGTAPAGNSQIGRAHV